MKRVISLVGCLIIGYLLAIYTYPALTKPRLLNPFSSNTPQTLFQEEEEKPQHIVDIPAKYFDPEIAREFDDMIMLSGIEVVYPPVAIESPADIEVIDREFNFEDEWIGKSPFDVHVDIDEDGYEEHSFEYGEPVDVDNDGEKEKILYAWVASNHPPHKVYIIKNGRIIYHTKDRGRASISLSESESHSGFYIWEATGETTPLFGVGAYKLTRFIYEDGKFIPVWYQNIFDLQTTQP